MNQQRRCLAGASLRPWMSVAIVFEVSSQVFRADVLCQAGYQEGRVFIRTPLNDYRHRGVVRDINTGWQFNSTVLYDCFDFSAHGAANYPRSRALRQRTCSTPRALRRNSSLSPLDGFVAASTQHRCYAPLALAVIFHFSLRRAYLPSCAMAIS